MSQTEERLEPDVERKLSAMWPSAADRATARGELRRYGAESFENEVERVRMAILKLGDGSLAELRRMTDAAKLDYRDVLMWAEYPEQSQAAWSSNPNLTKEQRRELDRIRTRDQAQLREWRRK